MAGESKIREYLKARVEAYGGEIRAVSWLGRRNAPDVLCLFPVTFGRAGHNVFVETKAPKGHPTAAQAREHVRMRAARCTVLVMSTEEQIDAWLSPK